MTGQHGTVADLEARLGRLAGLQLDKGQRVDGRDEDGAHPALHRHIEDHLLAWPNPARGAHHATHRRVGTDRLARRTEEEPWPITHHIDPPGLVKAELANARLKAEGHLDLVVGRGRERDAAETAVWFRAESAQPARSLDHHSAAGTEHPP